jgi:SM-20-related protein
LNLDFDELIDSFIENKIGISSKLFSNVLLANLKENLLALYATNAFKTAGTGDNNLVNYDAKFRGDEIYWLDRKHEDAHENSFFDVMDLFVQYLNETCYTGITEYEFHYAYYDTGTFYKKHLDQFAQKDTRKFSMILYLNTDWVLADGGELCVYQNDEAQNISPMNGKSVFFKSNELAHEVLVTNKPRLSITGWLKSNY